jgi:hypothetical protein
MHIYLTDGRSRSNIGLELLESAFCCSAVRVNKPDHDHKGQGSLGASPHFAEQYMAKAVLLFYISVSCNMAVEASYRT